MFILVLIGFPVVVAILLDFSIFKFATGQVDSWIMFWGSYLGAIIGASAVYFVAQLQIKKQHEQQIEAIRIENKHSISREIEQFLITTRLNKFEEAIKTCEKISDITLNLSNDFVEYVTLTDIINNEESPAREEEFKQKVYEIKRKHREYHALIILNVTELEILSNYSSDIKDNCISITTSLSNMWSEAKNCYFSKEGYKNYLKPNEKSLLKDFDFLISTLVQLIKVLNNNISLELTNIEQRIL